VMRPSTAVRPLKGKLVEAADIASGGNARNVNQGPAARVRPAQIRHAIPPNVWPHCLAGVHPSAGSFQIRASLGRNTSRSPLNDGGWLYVHKAGHLRRTAQRVDYVLHHSILGVPSIFCKSNLT
jgi:hypothetical protein